MEKIIKIVWGRTIGIKVVYIILLFLFISLILLTIIYFQGRVFDGVRSYILGEGLWAKAQKDAVIYLDRYSFSHRSEDYHAFFETIKVTIGDRNARLAMESEPVDYKRAFEGFKEGQNSVEDIDAMIWFYLNFKQISYLKEAIDIWQKADLKIENLRFLASEMQEAVRRHDEKILERLRGQLYLLNGDLYLLETRFSRVLAEGARWVKRTIWMVSIAILLLFVGSALWISRQIIKGIAKAERQLRMSESRFRSLYDSNTLGIISWHLDGTIEDANSYFLNMLGYTSHELEAGGLNWRSLTPLSYRSRDAQAIDELMQFGSCSPYEKELLCASGESVPVYLGASMVDAGNERGIAFFVDLREKKYQEEQLKLAAAVFDVSHDGIIITDSRFNVISVNKAVTDMNGFSAKELLGRKPTILQSDDTRHEEIYEELQYKGFWQGDLIDHTKEKLLFPVHLTISSVKDPSGVATHYVLVLFDITERKAREEQLSELANHDTLTGLYNRTHLEHQLESAIARCADKGKHFALLFFDLDKFKPVNDTYGHEVGDRLLKEVASRLNAHIRKSDTVARIGGDEFIILLESLDNRKRAEDIAQKVLKGLGKTIEIDEHRIEIGASVGISIYPEDGLDLKTLMEHADKEMYDMKGDATR